MGLGPQLGVSARNRMSWRDKVAHISWPMIFLIGCIASIGFAMLYSAAHGNADPWMDRQAARFAVGLAMIAKTRAARFDRSRNHLLDRRHQALGRIGRRRSPHVLAATTFKSTAGATFSTRF